jgi:nucleotidyltransferase substrate binding protein (TIGR01987 family)
MTSSSATGAHAGACIGGTVGCAQRKVDLHAFLCAGDTRLGRGKIAPSRPIQVFIMSEQDIRWLQRLSNYRRALAQLTRFIDKGDLNELEQQGLIKAFEFTHELAWNVLKDYFEYQGNTSISGSRDATREAFQYKLISDGETWMGMIKSRNQSAHTYNKDTADAIGSLIVRHYFSLFVALEVKLSELSHGL